MKGKSYGELRSAISKSDKAYPSARTHILHGSGGWPAERMDGLVAELFETGQVMVPEFVDTDACSAWQRNVSDRLESAGMLEQSRELQKTRPSNGPPARKLDGSTVSYRVSRNILGDYDTGMLSIEEPEGLLPGLSATIDSEFIRAIITAASNATKVKLSKQHIYYTEGLMNPRRLHWDSVRQQYKAFLYLTDVEERDDGPYTYVKHSHKPRWTRYANAWLNSKTGNVPTDVWLFRRANLTRYLAPKGTLIISNQRGYHGGTPQAADHTRVMAVSTYFTA